MKSSKAINIILVGLTVLWSMGLPGSIVWPAQASTAGEIIPLSTKFLTASKANEAVFGINISGTAAETLTSVKVTIGARAGEFVSSDLAAMGTGAGSGLGLYGDDKAAGTYGTYENQDDAITLASAPTLQTPYYNRLTPSATALAADSAIAGGLVLGDLVYVKTSDYSYSWNMVTTAAAGPADTALRLNNGGTQPALASGSLVSKFTPASTGAYTINGSSNTTSPALATGDLVYYHRTTEPVGGSFGILTQNLSATTFNINGQNLVTGTYQISKLASSFGAFTLGASGAITPAGTYTAPENGDLVFYAGNNSSGWGVVTDATLTVGVFAINGDILPASTTYLISKITGYSVAKAAVTSTSVASALGDVAFAYATDSNAANYSWHMVTATASGPGATSLRFDHWQNAPRWPYIATLTPATPVALPTSNSGNNSGADYFVTVSTSGTAVNSHRFQIGIAHGNEVRVSVGSTTMNALGAGFVEIQSGAPSITGDVSGPNGLNGYAGTSQIKVQFTKPVYNINGGPLTISDFALTDPGTGHTAHTLTGATISHTAGNNYAAITLTSALVANDIGSLTLRPLATIRDVSGNTASGVDNFVLTAPTYIATEVLPPATQGTAYTFTLAALGGSGSYTWSLTGSLPAGIGFNTTTGVLSGTPTVTGLYYLTITANGGTAYTKNFTLNVATPSGLYPSLMYISPAALSVNSSNVNLTVTGNNTHFTGSSSLAISGDGITIGSIVGTPTSTSLTVSVSVSGSATPGQRNITVTTASANETVMLTNGFTVLSGMAQGLTLQAPANSSTNVPLPPNFNFVPSSDNSVQAYKITLKQDASFSGNALWDYAFPAPSVTATSHCTSSICNVGYGAGDFRIMTPPAPLTGGVTYYWQVKTYNTIPFNITDSSVPLESTNIFNFSTGAVVDTQAPYVNHRPIMSVVDGADRTLVAKIMDNVATPTSTPALTTKLIYCNTSTSCTPATEVTGIYLSAGYWKFILPDSGIPSSGVVRYYLQATDGTNTNNFKMPDGTTPFTATVATLSTTNKIIGTTVDGSSNNTCLSGVYVFVEGYTFNNFSSLTACAGGTFSLSGVPAGTYDVVAFKDGYGERRLQGVASILTAASTPSYTMSLLSGGGGSGGGGSMSRPHVIFTGPPDSMSGIPGSQVGFKIFVTFDKAMNSNSITSPGSLLIKKFAGSTNETPASGSINGTSVTGTLGATVEYYANNTNSAVGPTQPNLMVITPTVAFGDNKMIVVIVTPNVRDTAGNQLEGNQQDGSYVFQFSTGTTCTSGCNYGTGAFNPPHVMGTTPKPGQMNVPTNTTLAVTFSDPMDLSTLNSTSVKLFSVVNNVESLVNVSTYALDTSKTILSLTTAGLNTGTSYRLKVYGGAKSATGVTMAPAGQTSTIVFASEFTTGSTTDVAAPTILGSSPVSNSTNVPVNMGGLMVAFSKALDTTTVNTTNVKLSVVGSDAVSGLVNYDDTKNAIVFTPKVALSSGTTYNLTLTGGAGGIKGANGVVLATTTTISFTTGSADSVAPTLMFANADDYALAVTFSESMQQAKASDTDNFATSVINPARYTIKQGVAGFDPASAGTVVDSSTATLQYVSEKNTVLISGLSLTQGSEFYIQVTGVKDLSGNTISGTNFVKGLVQSSTTTGGFLVPGTSSSGSFGGNQGPNFTSSGIGFMPPANAKPFNTTASVSTIYGVEIPLSKQIPATTGKIVITFPTGFDISGAKKDINSPPNSDINGPGTGVVVFGTAAETSGGANNDGVTVDQISRTVTVTLGAVSTRSVSGDTHDFLRFDLDGIINSSVPLDYGTAGYNLDIKTYSGTTVLESVVTQPFFITPGGNRTLTVTVTSASAITTGATKIYVGSPLTGLLNQTVTFSNSTSQSVNFTGLSDGDYMVYTEPIFTDTAPDPDEEWQGQPVPTNVKLSGGNLTKTITLTKLTGAVTSATVTLKIKGPAGELLDVMAGGPAGFSRKKVTLDGNAANYDTITMVLARSQKWYINVGPQMPDNSFSGPPPVPTYMVPKPVEVFIASNGSVVENSVDAAATNAANDGTVSFVLQSAGLAINGTVKDGSGNAIANAEVYGYMPQGGFGTRATASAQGKFTLNVLAGTYTVGAFVPGLPAGQEVAVNITAGGLVYVNGSTTSTTDVIIKLSKPEYTISGTVSNGNTVVNGAAVYAYKTDGPGGAQTQTDSKGNYTIYVSNGSWKVGAFIPGYGQLPEKTIVVASANQANQNFAPTTDNFGTVTGRIFRSADATYDAGEELSDVFVRVEGQATGGIFSANQAVTAIDGTYTIRIPAGTGYTIRAFKPGLGQLSPIDENLATITAFAVVAGQTYTKNIRTTAANTLTINFLKSAVAYAPAQAFVDLYNTTTNANNHAEVKSQSSVILSLPNGSYVFKTAVPGIDNSAISIASTGSVALSGATQGSTATVTGNGVINVTLPTLSTVSGTVYKTAAGAGNELEKAWVEFSSASNGVRSGVFTGSDGSYSLALANGTYKLQAMKPGFIGTPTTLVVAANSANNDIVLAPTSFKVSGQVLIGSVGAPRAFIRAEKVSQVGFVGVQADPNGNYEIYLSEGSWRLYGVAEGYQEVEYTTTSTVIASALTNVNITLTTPVTLKPPKALPITPAQGGEFVDSDAGLKMTFPASSLGSSAGSGQIQAKETNNVTKTSSAKVAGNIGKEIKATDSSGNPITTLSGSATIELQYTDANLTTSGIEAGDESKLNLAYWDDTANNWVTIPATLDTTTNTLRGNTDHLTVFAVVLPFAATPAAAAVSNGGGGGGSSGSVSSSGDTMAPSNTSIIISGGSIDTTTQNVTLTLSASDSSTPLQMMISNTADFVGAVWEPFISTRAWLLTSTLGTKTVYAKFKDAFGNISAVVTDTIVNKVGSQITPLEVDAPITQPSNNSNDKGAQQIVIINIEANNVVSKSPDELAQALGTTRNIQLEQKYYTSILAKHMPANTAATVKDDIVNFVTYGTPTTILLGAGERAGVVASFKSVYNRLPSTEADWGEVLKIANGRVPSVHNTVKEKDSLVIFKKIYGHVVDPKVPYDQNAINIMTYGLRISKRNLGSEASAIRSFRAIYGKAPTTTVDWDIVRAIAYSGAKRK